MNPLPWRMILMLVAAAVLAPPTHSQRRLSVHPTVFTGTDGAFQFSYPSDLQVCTAGNIAPCISPYYIAPCENDAIVCVVYPAKRFEGTSFSVAAFQVRAIHTERERMTPDVCVTPYPADSSAGVSEWPVFLISARRPAEIIGGVLFVHEIAGEAAMSHSSSVDLYRDFHRQKCYELSLSEAGTNSTPPMKTLPPAQQKDVDSFSDTAQLQISKVASLFTEG
jgi:hypothetical protein